MIRSQRAALVVLSALLFGCERSPEPASKPTIAAAPGDGKTTYDLIGVVREVEPGDRRVTIRHEAMPGFMAAMTMPFSLDDDDLLAELHPGDEVAGKLDVTRRDGRVQSYRLASLTVTRPATAAPPAPVVNLLEKGDAVPNFQMTRQDGSTAELSEYRGSWVALTFIYTRCPLPDFCPLMDRKFLELRQRLDQSADPAESVRLLSVSFDPEYDTPETLARHARQIGASPPAWTFAVANHDELARITPGLGLTYAPGDREIIHNLVTALIDPDGKLAALYRGRDWQPSELVRLIRSR